MDEDASRSRFSSLHLGSHTFGATLLLSLLSVLLATWALPTAYFVFGTGQVAPFLLSLGVFVGILLFKKQIFKNIYHNEPREGDAALLEYFVQQNTAANEEEEEMAVELLENALQLKDVRAQECMAPRSDIVHIDVSATVEELRQVFIESSLSRILVTDGELDHVLGYVHVQQMFTLPQSIRGMAMPIYFVPETISVKDLLNKFIKNRSSIACVVDEYGSLAGLVTLEDALEQLFGEIDDEHDHEEFIEVCVSEREFLFSGRLRIDDINEKYPVLALPEGDYQTLSGYLVAVTQTIPEQGAQLHLDGKTFVLELVSDRKIETVRILVD